MFKHTTLALAVFALLLTMCWHTTKQSTLPSEEPDREQTIVRFAVPDWELEQGNLYKLAEQFEAQNPGIHIEIKPFSQVLGLSSMEEFTVTDDLWLKLASGADVFRVIFINGIDRQPVHDGLVRDLSPFIDEDTTFKADDFHNGALDAAAWEGGVWAIPTALDYELVLFDKEAFDAAGVPYPVPGWTWDDLATRARALTVHHSGQVTRWGFVWVPFEPAEIIELRTGSLLDDTTTPPVPRFTESEVMEAVQWLVELTCHDQAIATESVQEGAAAMWSSSAWRVHSRQRNIGVVPYPIEKPDSETTPMHLEQIVMSASVFHPEAAWRWMDFLSRQPPGQPGWIPARRSVAEATGFWNKLDEELRLALRFAMDHAGRLSLSDWNVAYESLDTELWAVLKGEKSVTDALEAAQSRAEAGLAIEFTQRAAVTPVPTIVPDVGQRASEGTVVITFVPYNVAELNNFYDAAQRFQAVYPDLRVEIKPGPTTGDIASIAERADCFQAVPHLDAPGVLAAINSLDHLLDADPDLASDLFPSLLALYRRQGRLWGIPAEVQPFVIEYNQDIFNAAGQACPRSDWTTDDFLALVKTLTQGEGWNRRYGFVSTFELLDLLWFIERSGGRILDDTQDPPTATFDNPATIEAVTWYADLYLIHGIKPICLAENSRDCETLIQAGQAAMWSKSLTLGGGPVLNVLPFPNGPGGEGMPILNTEGYFISAKTTAPQACWDWIKFLTTETSVIQGLPARRSVAASEVYHQLAGPELVAAYLTAVENQRLSDLHYLINQDWLNPYLSWLEQAYRQIVEERETPARALVEVQRKADAYRACVISRDALYERERWEACLREVDPTLPEAPCGAEE